MFYFMLFSGVTFFVFGIISFLIKIFGKKDGDWERAYPSIIILWVFAGFCFYKTFFDYAEGLTRTSCKETKKVVKEWEGVEYYDRECQVSQKKIRINGEWKTVKE